MEELGKNLKFGGQATTCHTTAYAAVNYFCGYGGYDNSVAGFSDPDQMLQFIKWHPKGTHAIFRGGVGTSGDNRSHVYVLQALPDQTYQMYAHFLFLYK
jgi:hypothetical protein